MNRSNIKDYLKQTSRRLFKEIDKYGIRTGSKEFGVSDKSSDIDIILPPDFKYSWDEIYQYHNGLYLQGSSIDLIPHYWEEGFKSIYVLYKNQVLNLILTETEEEYNRWVYATIRMKRAINNPKILEKIKNKEHRIQLFLKFKKPYKTGIIF